MDEFDWISRLLAPIAKAPEALGLLDDVAVVADHKGVLLVTQDALVEAVHFLSGTPPEKVAAKLVAVNASDIGAKGGVCDWALLTFGRPPGLSRGDLDTFAAGLARALDDVGASLIGGDTVSSPNGLFVSLTMMGHCLGSGPVLRSGAGVGDDLWVSGEIGHGGVGLIDARARRTSPSSAHYLCPLLPPRGVVAAIATCATASLDVSDGLLGDAQKLANASGVGLHLHLEDIPLADPAEARLDLIGQVTAGDDYQALFTAPPRHRAALQGLRSGERACVTRIGVATESPGLSLSRNGAPFAVPQTLGFSHGD